MTKDPALTPNGRQEYQNGPESGRETVTAPDLDAIRARLTAATDGPWNNIYGEVVGTLNEGDEWLVADVSTRPDAELIAHAPADLAALLDEVERLTAERDEWRRTARARRERAEAAEKRADDLTVVARSVIDWWDGNGHGNHPADLIDDLRNLLPDDTKETDRG